MRLKNIALCCCVSFAFTCCKKQAAPQLAQQKQNSPAPAQSALPQPPPNVIDACGLLTSDEIQSVLGEPVKETKRSGQPAGALAISQCYFALPTAVNSMVLTVFEKGSGADARDPSASWKEIFEREGERDRKGDEEGEKKAEPVKVDGVGDQAFWTGHAIGGALYVLKANTYIRISIGGRDDQAGKIKKCTALAQMVLKHL